MDLDTLATLKLDSRIPAEPRWIGLGYCPHCRCAAWMNSEGHCQMCWESTRWARENRAVCDLIHRGVAGAPRLERGSSDSKSDA